MRTALILGLAAAAFSGPALAQTSVQLTRAVFVERFTPGNMVRTIEPARDLRKGDTVILVIEWEGAKAGKAFTVTSPVPSTLQFRDSSSDAQSVSIDGGRNWGKLGSLRIATRSGSRLATPEDVTHLRWRISASAANNREGQITYSAIVK